MLLVAALLPWPAATATAPVKAIRFGKLVDGTGRVITNALVVIEGDRIKSVGAGNSAGISNVWRSKAVGMSPCAYLLLGPMKISLSNCWRRNPSWSIPDTFTISRATGISS
jgi:hypothetical protein